jgi:hypothetical protein
MLPSPLTSTLLSIPDAILELKERLIGEPRPKWLAGRLASTGLGCSEGPARLFAHVHGCPYLHASNLVLGNVSRGHHEFPETLIVFSHGLSPNAQLLLRATESQRRVLITGTQTMAKTEVTAEAQLVVAAVSGKPEEGSLLRVRSPVLASLAAIHWTGATIPWESLAEQYASPKGSPAPSGQDLQARQLLAAVHKANSRVCILHGHPDGAAFQGLSQKLTEGLGVLASEWDVLQFAHGPLQALYAQRGLVLLLENHDSPLGFAHRVASTLDPSRHTLFRLRSHLPSPFTFFAFDAFLNRVVALHQALESEQKTEPFSAASRGRDRALYDIADRRMLSEAPSVGIEHASVTTINLAHAL